MCKICDEHFRNVVKEELRKASQTFGPFPYKKDDENQPCLTEQVLRESDVALVVCHCPKCSGRI